MTDANNHSQYINANSTGNTSSQFVNADVSGSTGPQFANNSSQFVNTNNGSQIANADVSGSTGPQFANNSSQFVNTNSGSNFANVNDIGNSGSQFSGGNGGYPQYSQFGSVGGAGGYPQNAPNAMNPHTPGNTIPSPYNSGVRQYNTGHNNSGQVSSNMNMQGNTTPNTMPLTPGNSMQVSQPMNQIENTQPSLMQSRPLQFNFDDVPGVVDTIYNETMYMNQVMQELIRDQSSLFNNAYLDQNLIQNLSLRHNEVSMRLQEMMGVLRMINQSVIVDIHPLHTMFYTHRDIVMHIKQLELLVYELKAKISNDFSQNFCALIITREPFPEIITKSQKLGNEVLIVKLITGASVNVQQCFPVNVRMIRSTTSNAKQPIFPTEAPLDPLTNEARFPLRFKEGTRKSVVNLVFSTQVRVIGMSRIEETIVVESTPTSPFIVITNENQWQVSEEEILKIDAFQNNVTLPWISFCNTLQRHFIRVTRQDTDKPFRTLTVTDFSYIHRRFFDLQESVIHSTFEKFFKWFGKILSNIRYTRYLNKLWQNGLVYGFMSRRGTEEALNGRDPGTFIIRFSERYEGRFAIAYVNALGDKILHYLIKDNDTSKKRTLGDFLFDCDQFAYILKFNSFDENGNYVFTAQNKKDAFRQYCSPSKQKEMEDDVGYDPLENPWAGITLPPSQGDTKRRKRTADEIY
eukprot:TRINITY_DN2259_c0_g1_i1.p1 TRINITY_DN2259_c0_g1~~TRINITY_DN2259_c0_g1_i1.p1  ORF type:complete len:737 (-),score=128.03 TRINITY_DN2259_c0_g1_i1:41-2107(-)